MKRLNLNNHWIAIGVLFVMAVTIAVIAYLLAFRFISCRAIPLRYWALLCGWHGLQVLWFMCFVKSCTRISPNLLCCR